MPPCICWARCFSYFVTKATSFGSVYALMFIYCLCYFPTIALTNSLTLQHLKDTGRDFPLIRVFGTLGWIAIGVTIGRLGVETSTVPFLLAAGASVVMSIFSLTLPHTPPPSKGQSVTLRRILGLDALVMLKRPSFAVFAVASILACIPLTFYFSFTNAYLNSLHVPNAAGKMALGQASEVVMMLLMPFILRRVSVRSILIMGLLAWSVRYMLLAYGNPDSAHLDVLCGHPAPWHLLRLLFHDRAALHRPGSSSQSAKRRTRTDYVPDLWSRNADRVSDFRPDGRLFHSHRRDRSGPQLAGLLDDLRVERLCHPAADRHLLPQPRQIEATAPVSEAVAS